MLKLNIQRFAEGDLQDIMVSDEAHYFGDSTGTTITLGGVITELTESSNPEESEKQYIHQKSKTVKVIILSSISITLFPYKPTS